MILPVYVYGSPILRKVAVEITPDYPDLKQFFTDMWDTMYYADGVGLAAPQVGRSIRLIVIDTSVIAKDDEAAKNFKKLLINPTIIERTGDQMSYTEGCLSIPGLHENVARDSKVRIKYYDENFVEHNESYEGVIARVIQHEYDHLEGIMFVDRLSALRKKLIKSKLIGMTKGKYDADYKTKIG
ncbi:MAG: peptide deformylase [Prevotellaceae bacterium]|jgi:peptide deformylase|nr:peptide deformylase [Prevotellaceae bacterium]